MHPYLIYVCAMMAFLLGTARLASGANCACPKIPEKAFTLPEDHCFDINSKYRYKCIEGFVRKEGTSNLIRCQNKSGVLQWTNSSFECIPDPKNPTEPRTSLYVTTQPLQWPGTPTSLQSFRTSTSKATKSLNMEQTTLGGDPTTVCTILSVMILFFTMSGVIFLLYQRRNKQIPSKETEEQEPMNC